VQDQRARILLLAAEGVANSKIAERLGVPRPTVIAWRKRYAQEGLTGRPADRARRGRPDRAPDPTRGVTSWSSRLLASELGVSHSTAARAGRSHPT
jgi:transposase-like protein